MRSLHVNRWLIYHITYLVKTAPTNNSGEPSSVKSPLLLNNSPENTIDQQLPQSACTSVNQISYSWLGLLLIADRLATNLVDLLPWNLVLSQTANLSTLPSTNHQPVNFGGQAFEWNSTESRSPPNPRQQSLPSLLPRCLNLRTTNQASLFRVWRPGKIIDQIESSAQVMKRIHRLRQSTPINRPTEM